MPKHLRPLLWIGGLLLAVFVAAQWVRGLPPEQSPFAKLDLERPIGWATEMQLARIQQDAPACTAALDASEMGFEPIEDRRTGAAGGCGFSNAVAMTQSTYSYSNAVRISCPLAAALYIWEREVVAPAAERLESPVARIEMIGAYSCRNVYGRADARLSEHATANAIDISGFRLENGRLITIAADWGAGDADGAFLRELRNGGCRVFRTVLSPDYNRAHADHFHFDMGSYSVCS
jgi:hypothetical protein